jgi:UDPglucose 6-dehydrogenase
MNKVIACIGNGFVGGSLTTVFSERGFDVYAYDKLGKYASGAKKIENAIDLSTFILEVEKNRLFSGIFFVCLPTPMKKNGSCDISIVESVLDELASNKNNLYGLNRIAVVKSTVPPGTIESWNKKYDASLLRVVFNPEFLTEANALNDMRNQDRIILGGSEINTRKVEALYKIAFDSVPVYKTSSTNAEMVKYVANCFLATKVSFANEMYQACEKLFNQGCDVSYNSIVELAKLDRRIGDSHWQVPGPMPSDDSGAPAFGFGGSCFPKDINSLIYVLENLGIDPKVLRAVWEKNLEVRPQKDWEKLKGRATSENE